MIPLRFAQDTLRQARWQGDWPHSLGEFLIDSRAIQPGQVFVALPGSRSDGHDFIAAARAAGAAGALVARAVDDPLPQCIVPEVLPALQQLAQAWRAQWSGRLVALTGSNGKTTVKEMLAAILAPFGPCCVTRGNLNNHIGVPLTLLRLDAGMRYAVIEMGANHAGEIALLTRLAAPDVGLVTLAAPAHLEGFGSLEGVARAKGEIFSTMGAHAQAVINADDPFRPLWQSLAGGRYQWLFGAEGDVRAEEVVLDASGTQCLVKGPNFELNLRLNTAGWHNVQNALAATAAAYALGISPDAIGQGLRAFRPVEGRLRQTRLSGERLLIDDSYNANPGSVRAAIDVLAQLPSPRLLCLGDMAELGDAAATAHAEMGAYALERGIDGLWLVGNLVAEAAKAFGAQARHFPDRASLIGAWEAEGEAYRSVLVKGSRSAGMDVVVSAMNKEAAHA